MLVLRHIEFMRIVIVRYRQVAAEFACKYTSDGIVEFDTCDRSLSGG